MLSGLIGMNGLGVVSIVVGGAVMIFSALAAFGAGLGMVLNSQIRREQEQRESEELAEALMRRKYEPKPPPQPIEWVRPMSHKREISLDMSAAEIGHALSDLLEPGGPAPMPAASQCLRDGAAHSERADRQQHS